MIFFNGVCDYGNLGNYVGGDRYIWGIGNFGIFFYWYFGFKLCDWFGFDDCLY